MFPSTISTFNIVSASDRLNSPSHSALHNSVSSVLTQVQTVIGTDTASALGTIIGDLRNPSSDGGGHVQTAVKGGTGQTSFTKGDLFVASGPSTISKLAVGTDGNYLKSNSSMAAGVEWSAAPGKLYVNASIVTAPSGLPGRESSIFSFTVPGSILGTNNAIRATNYVSAMRFQATSVLVKAFYGGGITSSVMIRPTAAVNASTYGTISYTLIANNSASLQRGILQVKIGQNLNPSAPTSTIAILAYDQNISSVNSSASQTMGATIIKTDSDDQYNIDATIVEKIS